MRVLWSPIDCKIKENYFNGKIQGLYKLKTKTSPKGQEIVFLISVMTITSGISTHTTTNVSLTLSVAV